MLTDTHCHLNIVAKDTFDIPLTEQDIARAATILEHAKEQGVSYFINVGTSLIESKNCITLAQRFAHNYAAVGIHPNDLHENWQQDIAALKKLVQEKEHNKIVAIGECGLDKHYPDYNLQQQRDALDAQIELALNNDLALIIHTRDARDETLRALEPYKKDITRGIIHCFSEDQDFANTVISWGYAIGLGGTITYPKNNALREIAKKVSLESVVLETDAPFLPPQSHRGKKNLPGYLVLTAQYLANLRGIEYAELAQTTTHNARTIFRIPTL